jgi:hypothetical protein
MVLGNTITSATDKNFGDFLGDRSLVAKTPLFTRG